MLPELASALVVAAQLSQYSLVRIGAIVVLAVPCTGVPLLLWVVGNGYMRNTEKLPRMQGGKTTNLQC